MENGDQTKPIVNKFEVCCTNVDMMSQHKFQQLQFRVRQAQPMVIAISEVKPKSFKRDIQLVEYKSGYEMIATNLSRESKGRGLILYMKDTLNKADLTLRYIIISNSSLTFFVMLDTKVSLNLGYNLDQKSFSHNVRVDFVFLTTKCLQYHDLSSFVL